jgi:hypothetical protein
MDTLSSVLTEATQHMHRPMYHVYKLLRRMAREKAADIIRQSPAFREEETCKTCSIRAGGLAVDKSTLCVNYSDKQSASSN